MVEGSTEPELILPSGSGDGALICPALPPASSSCKTPRPTASNNSLTTLKALVSPRVGGVGREKAVEEVRREERRWALI